LKVQNQKDHTKRRYSHAWGRDEKSRARVRKSRIREEFEEIERRGGIENAKRRGQQHRGQGNGLPWPSSWSPSTSSPKTSPSTSPAFGSIDDKHGTHK
jgi:hypothetical protein